MTDQEMKSNSKPDGKWLNMLWRGENRARPGVVIFIWVLIRLFLSKWLWGTAVRLAHFPSLIKTAGLVLALISIFLFLWALWGLWQTIRSLGLKRLTVAFILVFIVITTINVLTVPDELPLGPRLLSLTNTTAGQIKNSLAGWVNAVTQAPDDFLFAYSGQIRAPELPPGFPTPDPQATPVQAFARPGGE